VGVARKDGENGAAAVLQHLSVLPKLVDIDAIMDDLKRRIDLIDNPVITKKELCILEELERTQALEKGLEEFKFMTNDEMLEAMGFRSKNVP
jgi:hypothetical protein